MITQKRGPATPATCVRHRPHFAHGGRRVSRRPLERGGDQAGRADRAQPGGARAALCEHVLRGIQGVPSCRRIGPHLPHGPAHRAHAPERAAAGAAGTGRGAARRHGARGHRTLPPEPCRRRRARCICGRSCSARRRTSVPRRRPPSEALLLVLASPVWDYFAGGMKPLRILVDDENTRSAAQMGMVKTGGNYAAAIGPTLSARAQVSGGPGAVLPARRGAGDGRREFLVDPRRRASRRAASTALSSTA